MRVFTLLIVVSQIFFSSAQTVGEINFDTLKSTIENSESSYYYPNLISRLKCRDTTLTQKEYWYLYYGAVFQPEYHPYGATYTKSHFLKRFSENASNEELLSLGEDVFNENPVDLQVLLKLLFVCSKSKNREKALEFSRVYVAFLEVIYNSGDGKSCETSFVVTSVDDEYSITEDLGLIVIQQDLLGECDQLIFDRKGQKRDTRIKALYFNVRMPLTHLSNSYNKSDLPDPDVDPDEEE